MNRILKLRFENELSDYSEDESGKIVKRPRVKKNIIEKTSDII